MKTNTNLIIGTVVVIAVGLMFLPQLLKNGGSLEQQNIVLKETDHIKGAATSSVVLIEYSDFECPACAAYFPLVGAVVEQYKDDIQFVYRHFPLTQIHPRAIPAAVASEAAGKQGKFFEMHDLLFENQQTWRREGVARDHFVSYAQELGLNMDQFLIDLEDEALTRRVQEDFAEGRSLNVTGTPTFFLNGKKIVNPQSLNEFVSLIEEELNQIQAN